jgi:hypothetical protein
MWKCAIGHTTNKLPPPNYKTKYVFNCSCGWPFVLDKELVWKKCASMLLHELGDALNDQRDEIAYTASLEEYYDQALKELQNEHTKTN